MHGLTTCGCSLVAGYFCCYCYCYCSWCLSFVFVGIVAESFFPFFVQKLITTEKLAAGNTGRSLLNTKILVNTKPSSDYEYRDIQIDEWIEKIG